MAKSLQDLSDNKKRPRRAMGACSAGAYKDGSTGAWSEIISSTITG